MTTNDYQQFVEDFSFTASEFKKWLNDVVLRNGIPTPYTMAEFDTEIVFMPEAMHVMIDVRDEAYVYLEQEFWADYK